MRTIRKYPNRSLYDTEAGCFIKLSDIRDLIAAGHELRVEDKTSGEDITRPLLLQVISEAEADGHPILSTRLLTDLIRLHDHPMHDYMTPYLERSVAIFMNQIDQMQSRIGDMMEAGPLKAWQNYTQESLSWWKQFMPGMGPSDNDSKR